MASKKARAGIRSFQIASGSSPAESFDVGSSTEVEVSGEVRETLESANNPAPGYSVKQKRGRLSVEVIDHGGLSLARMMGWSDVSATLVLANGKAYAADGWLVDPPTLDAQSGMLTLVIEGIVTEQVFG